jgi:hypothetical protein
MSETNERPNLLVPDDRIVSIDEARTEQERKRRPPGKDGDFITRREYTNEIAKTVADLNEQLARGIAGGLLATGQRMYSQWSAESGAFLEAMEVDIEARIVARIENERRERSWRRRGRRLLARLGWKEQAPALVEEVAAEPEDELVEIEDAALEEALHDGE